MYIRKTKTRQFNNKDYFSYRVVESIRYDIQDRVARAEAERFMVAEFDKLSEEDAEPSVSGQFLQLRNLIHALGGAFHEILLSDRSERRVFSVAFSDAPDDEILRIFKLGVQFGYFHEASIGNKEGTGRTRMFVLSRRLAPYFMLDPTAFAGYKFVTNAAVKEAIVRPRAFISRIAKGELLEDAPQLGLFDRSKGDENFDIEGRE